MIHILAKITTSLILSLFLCYLFNYKFYKKEDIILKIKAKSKNCSIMLVYNHKNNKKIINKTIEILNKGLLIKLEEELNFIKLKNLNYCIFENIQFINININNIKNNNKEIYFTNLISEKLDLKYFIYSLFYFILIFFIFISINFQNLIDIINRSNSINPKYYKNIEFLRILFTIGIIANHLNILKTNIMVEFFFIISGFFLSKSIDKIEKLDFKSYFIKRYIRLFPQYLFIMFCFHRKSFFQALIGFDIIFDRPLNTNDKLLNDLWFIPVLFWVENFIFCMFKYLNNSANFILSIIIFVLLRYYLHFKGNTYIFFMIRGLAFTGIGYFLNLFHRNIKLIMLCPNENFITFLEIFSFTFFIKNIEDYPRIILSMWFFFIIYFFIENKGGLSRILNNNIFIYISKYCYSVYISHENISRDLFRKINIYRKLNIIDDRFIIIIISFFVGMFFYHSNELFQKLLKNLFNNKINKEKNAYKMKIIKIKD